MGAFWRYKALPCTTTTGGRGGWHGRLWNHGMVLVVGVFLAMIMLWMGIVKDKKQPARLLAGACRGGEEYDLSLKHFLLGCQRPPDPL